MRRRLNIFVSLALFSVIPRLGTAEQQVAVGVQGDAHQRDKLAESLRANSLDLNAVRELAGTSGFKLYQGSPVLAPGEHREWDAGAIGSMSVIRAGDVLHMYYEAWGESVDAKDLDFSSLQIGHAVSLDGIHWMKDPANPVITKGAPGEWDADGTWDPFVLYENGVFKLWYGGGIDRRCDYGFAESNDGTHFDKRGQISHIGQLSDGHVMRRSEGEPYRLFYFDKRFEPRNALFCAEAPDETHFDFDAATPIIIDGESPDAMYKFSHVFMYDGTWYMLYANFVRPHAGDSATRLAQSVDGIHWTSINRNLFAGHDAEVVTLDGALHLVYFSQRGFYNQPKCDVRLAIFHGPWSKLQKEIKSNTAE